ncbi:unnamed protein product [Calicophoron daubneyi]|uniref:Integrase catalytic domain-containing protein n=1 Tax=Calicophoron daubneyi TaxID=300641 RepID=A0AAV2TIB9_CALDB
MIDGLLTECKRVSNTADALSHLAVRMQNCNLSLTQMNYQADLNSLSTLEGVVRGLPHALQVQWAEEADRILVAGREPNFYDLTQFVTNRSRVARGRFGQLAERCVEPSKSAGANLGARAKEYRREVAKSAMLTTSGSGSNALVCPMCACSHRLADCAAFAKLSVPERWDAAKRIRACFSCLESSHRSSACRRKSACDVDNCPKLHHKLLHVLRGSKEEQSNTEDKVCNAASVKKSVRLGVLPVKVHTSKGTVETLAFLDSGSDTTLIKRSFMDRHGIKGAPLTLTVSTLGGTRKSDSVKVGFTILSIDEREHIKLEEAYAVDDIPIRPPTTNRDEANKWPHLKDIDFYDTTCKEVTLLIGCDVPEAHWALDQRISGRKLPYAVQTLLGWVLCGPVGEVNKSQAFIHLANVDAEMLEQLKSLYNNEFCDTSTLDSSPSQDDVRVINMLEENARLTDGRFEFPLPWRDAKPCLPDNRSMAERRLAHLRRRLTRDCTLFGKYKVVMQHNIDRGYMETLNASPCAREDEPCWYLPHHPVLNPKKPDKLRIVFDCAAKFGNVSLNDKLLQGPDLTNNLVAILTRFRLYAVAVAADIEEMFFQVRVPEKDRNALRVLWWPEHDLARDPVDYRLTVHPFGAVSSPCCANLALRKTASTFGHLFDPGVTKAIVENFYVDDYLTSFTDKQTASVHVSQIASLLSMGGFRLTKWFSNNRAVINDIPESERAKSLKEIAATCLPIERALGVTWDAESDEFVLSFCLPDKPVTRRGILSAVSSLFDPLGFVSPWLLPGKILLQDLCRKKLGWDDPLSEEDLNRWKSWTVLFQQLQEVRVPRRIGPCGVSLEHAEVHVFSDASEVGYGAVAYMCVPDALGRRISNLLISKARVAPLKGVSIPRLELAAAKLAVQVGHSLCGCLPVDSRKFSYWSDSMVVLYYINNASTRFSTFVSNRLAYIHDNSHPDQWRHISSEENPADMTSRGLTSRRGLATWLSGPTFLQSGPKTWPNAFKIEPPVSGIELKKAKVNLIFQASDSLHSLLLRYSSWHKLLRAVAWILRFKDYWLTMKTRQQRHTVRLGNINKREIEMAERSVVSLVQWLTFRKEMLVLTTRTSTGNKSLRKDSPLLRLAPVVIDGVLRVGGRLEKSSLPYESKHPILLPRLHHVTDLVIRHHHLTEGHAGVHHVLAVTRMRFWIIGGASTVKRAIGNCMICRRLNAQPGEQMMAPLPTARVQTGWYPFMHVGLDYFGPIEVKCARSREKRYGCIITCLQSRAVYLDVAYDMSTDAFLLLLSRFVARRGLPSDIYSDNGSNFVGASKVLSDWVTTLDKNRLNDKMLERGVHWHFNPPYASHRGGVWERIIRSVRKLLSAVCNEQLLDDEALASALIEIERILNNRPLTPVSNEDSNTCALTPNHLLLMRESAGLNPSETLTERYSSRWKQIQHIAKTFWKRWTKEYLPLLQVRQKWARPKRNFVEGDVVLVANEASTKNQWPLGRVVKAHVSEDGQTRMVEVRTAKGVLLRDVRRLCLLESEQAN